MLFGIVANTGFLTGCLLLSACSSKDIGDAVFLLFFGFLAAVGILVVRYVKSKGKDQTGKSGIPLKPSRPQFEEKYGGTHEERQRRINQMFDAANETLRVSMRYDWTPKDRGQNPDALHLHVQVSRHLATMDLREREALRTAYLLFSADLLNENGFRFFRFAFINGDGKASAEVVSSWVYHDMQLSNAVAQTRFVRERLGAAVDTALSELFTIVERLSRQAQIPPVVVEIQNRMRGGGVWLSPQDIAGSIFAGGTDGNVLTLGRLDGSDELLTYGGEGSLITIAPPGSGKTQCFVLPNMLRWKGPAVVLDIKGELHQKTAKWRSENVGPVYKFSPLDPANSHRYNPLAFIRQEPDYLWEDSRFLADMMIVPSGGTDPFWENMARDVVTAAIAYVCYHSGPEQRPMSKVMDILFGINWDTMVASLKTNLAVSAMRQTGHSLGEMEKRTRDSVLKTAQSCMSVWQGERMNRSTIRSDWSPLDLRSGKPTIYICVSPNEIDSLLSVLRVFIAQHIRMLTSQLPPKEAPPVLFILDEMPRLKKMPPIDEAINIGRQYGIKLWMFAQSYGQLKEAYPNAEGMMGSCAVRMFMNVPLNDELAQRISDQLGYREGILDKTRVKLVEPMELAGPDFRDLALIVASSTKPAKIRKAFAYADPELSRLME